MIIAFDIDYVATAIPDIIEAQAQFYRGRGDTVLYLSSMIQEVGTRTENFKYRVKQLRKLGLISFDAILLADGESKEELANSKAVLCNKFGVNVVFDDDPAFCVSMSQHAYVFQFHRKQAWESPTKNSFRRI